ncbi:hypothetical protein CALVIDRAFT_595650 [Calocera viscosa TUFC12733]|uniref:NADAR domain-containing protein n=1 Tax=Calocera viscosa (strain TUFC12733) TaxID=1330018 RepID=A0A167QV99_CALVF|nr:hypothetical protein CALVIDRAFT_595650 [Calocera viscosa TUFC12733]
MSHPSKAHPFGPFTNPYYPPPPAQAPVQHAPWGPAPPAPAAIGVAPPNGAYALNRVYGHAGPVGPAHAPLPPPTWGYAPPVAPAAAPAPAPAPRRVHFAPASPTPLNPAQLSRVVPASIFRSPNNSANSSVDTSPAARNYALPQAPPRIVLGGRQPPGMPHEAHPNFKLNSNHMISCRGKMYVNIERLYHSRKFGDSPTTPDMEHLIELVAGSADPRGEAEQWRAYWRRDWEYVKDSVMVDALRHKMAQYPEILAELLATGNADIIDAEDPSNTLGRALMGFRAEVAPRRR